ncbi:fatty acid hydroxylase family protein [Alteromonadaceae bacterium M269]|nr:fatty acid hydroxylase family protein [Alteromonadaceae bacterium M269]
MFIDRLFQFWIESHWSVALVMSSVVNISVYVITALTMSRLIKVMTTKKLGEYIDDRSLKDGQIKQEVSFGIIACIVFAVGSLATREVFHKIWPESISDFFVQTLCFVIFYETYSYFVHLLLHQKFFSKYHRIHHLSVRVTPWSAYSVHPLEASFIGFSAPLFMLFVPMSLGLALVLHVFGMMFTIMLHSSYRHRSNSRLIKWMNEYPRYHSKHHIYGTVNYGFVGSILG